MTAKQAIKKIYNFNFGEMKRNTLATFILSSILALAGYVTKLHNTIDAKQDTVIVKADSLNTAKRTLRLDVDSVKDDVREIKKSVAELSKIVKSQQSMINQQAMTNYYNHYEDSVKFTVVDLQYNSLFKMITHSN